MTLLILIGSGEKRKNWRAIKVEESGFWGREIRLINRGGHLLVFFIKRFDSTFALTFQLPLLSELKRNQRFFISRQEQSMSTLKLKALVDKETNRIIFIESDEHLVDTLFSFLTLPMGTIINLIRAQTELGSMNNLYKSVENLESKFLSTNHCQGMLLNPRKASAEVYLRIKVRVDNDENRMYFCGYCHSVYNSTSEHKLVSHYNLVSHYCYAVCRCRNSMFHKIELCGSYNRAQDEGVFVKRLTRFLVSDELQVMISSTAASVSLLSRFGLTDASSIEERTFDFGMKEAVELLRCSLISNTPLTETFLKSKAGTESSKSGSSQAIYSFGNQTKASNPDNKEKIPIKLVISKSKLKVCFAEAREDFVNLLFSFLTIPLGYVVSKMQCDDLRTRGSVHHLYSSIQNSEVEKYLKSNELKEMLLSPKIAPCFGYKNQQLDIDEMSRELFFCGLVFSSDRKFLVSSSGSANAIRTLTVVDPKIPTEEVEGSGGFVTGPAMFTVTDDLVITPMSPVFGLTLLNKLNVSFDDIEERIVQVGAKEASLLLVAAFTSGTVLTDVLIRAKPEANDDDAVRKNVKLEQ